ncbi:nucleotidyltransferase family protein [Methylobacter sp.]|uniref:nucleotidyltransferase domain-containing protein n=1 Tax=Methylobacter sp. TaxID=2051955 RepID=UPI001224B778|nr:nucleotidyltransferase family protein [Methylobacter sp.]TAK61296.1 MAG: hypothetical protein EPO18_14200 [Methylobacter sp.]
MDKNIANLLIKQLVFARTEDCHTNTNWELLLRQARAAGVMSRLAFFWKKFGMFEPPGFAATHLNSAYKYWLSQKRIVNWELHNLQQVFEQLKLPLILLKGTAYSAANLNADLGRVFSDIDILVPKQRLQEVKEALKWNGWFPEPLDSYDQNYYERWMHELPPMRHIQRGTTLDIHHNILPETCALYPDANLLLNSAVNIPNSNYWILAPEDMILHTASHLFWGGEFENGLRDLSDIDLLLREFSDKNSRFWQNLLDRADTLGLGKPLFYALRYSNKILKTPTPESIITASMIYSPGSSKIKIMDFLFLRALNPPHPTCNDKWTGFARWLLYIRSHWLKMPLHLLIPHLSRKSWLRLTNQGHH